MRVRFCPSPTGTPHVGLIRTALFNFAFARRFGGKFIFRIENTDSNRDTDESLQAIIDAMLWLGLKWDEGPDPADPSKSIGPYGPYLQSLRKDLYKSVLKKLIDAGFVYESFLDREEIEEKNKSLGRDPRLGYYNFERNLSRAQREDYIAQGRQPSLRFAMPDEDLYFDDIVRGHVRFAKETFGDYVLVRPGGDPLYTFANPVDDALMKITHICRGEDLLSSTPRQIALYRALVQVGVAEQIPQFAHLPHILGEGNRKLSKRDSSSNLFLYRDQGFLEEGLLNYLALLGWSIAPDRDVFSLSEMLDKFDMKDVNPNPAKFDYKKALAINAEHMKQISLDQFCQKCVPYLQNAGMLPKDREDAVFKVRFALFCRIAPHVQLRVRLLAEVPPMVEFLYKKDTQLQYAGIDTLGSECARIALAAHDVLCEIEQFTSTNIEQALREMLQKMELTPRDAFGVVRLAICDQRVSPPLFESLEVLGQKRTLARLKHFAEGARDRHV